MKVKEFLPYEKPIEFPQYDLTVEGIWHIVADDDMHFVRKTDGKEFEEGYLGIEFRDKDGNLLEHPYIEKPEDYDEVPIPVPNEEEKEVEDDNR